MKSFFTIAMCVLVLAGCQWVKPRAGAEQVSLVKPSHVYDCQKIGSTSSSVRSKVGFVARKPAKVAQELVVLAKNEAAKLGGDTIVAQGEIVDGSQSFDVYQCGAGQ